MRVARLHGPLAAILVLLSGVGGAAAEEPAAPAGEAAEIPALAPVGTGFTYQGRLTDANGPVTNTCDFEFSLWDSLSSGIGQIGDTQTISNVTVTGGLFTVELNGDGQFGANAFNGDARWLAIAPRCPAGSGSYALLSPRQPITPAPYALFALKSKAYQNVVVVAQSGGDFSSIQAALNSITTNSASNRYLVWVAPGTYTGMVTMKPYVDIEGAGELATRLTAAGTANASSGTVNGANNAELRLLTVESTGGAAYAIAIYMSFTSPRLTHVTAIASGASNSAYGVASVLSSARLTEVTASASGGPGTTTYGIYSTTASPAPTLINVAASATGGGTNYAIYNSDASPVMTNVTAAASGGSTNYGVYNSAASPAMTNVTATASNGSSNNYGVYNTAGSSPAMANMSAIASGGGNNAYGVYNDASSPIMTNVMASGRDGPGSNRGVWNVSASPVMNGVTIIVSGGLINYGIGNHSSSPTISGSSIQAIPGSSGSYGIANFASPGTHTVRISNTRISASVSTVYNDPGFTVRVGGSWLEGGPVSGAGVTCAGVYDENFAFFSNTCP